MIDREHNELAGLHALDLLEGAERLGFERELRCNPAVREAVGEARDTAAAIARSARPLEPSRDLRPDIYRRLGRGSATTSLTALVAVPLPTPTAPKWRLHPAWVAAAACAVLAGWLGVTVRQRSAELAVLRARLDRDKGSFSGVAGPDSSGGLVRREPPHPSADAATTHAGPALPPDGYFSGRNGPRELRLIQDAERHNPDGRHLGTASDGHFTPPAGVSDLRVLEMRPPGAAARPETRKNLLSDDVATAIAAGLNREPLKAPDSGAAAPTEGKASTVPDSPASPKPAPLHLKGNGASPANDIFVDQGMVNLNALQLHPDSQVVHNAFPGDDEFNRYGLTRIDPDTVWDGQGWVWHRGSDGRYIGQKTPQGWQPPDPDDPQSVTPPPLRPAPPPSDAPAASSPVASDANLTSSESSPAEPYALPIVDHEGRGTLIVQNLPPPPADQVYQLWMIDGPDGTPVSVGVLPPTPNGTDHFAFEMGQPGRLPAGYLLTLESPGTVSQPRGKVILQGP